MSSAKNQVRALFWSMLVICVLTMPMAEAQETPFSHPDVSLSLPEGWKIDPIPANFEKEVIGWFKSDKIAGSSIMVMSYKGWRFNYNNVRIAGLKTIGASYPKGQEMLKGPETTENDSGLAAKVEFWKGAVDAGGTIVFLESPMATVETSKTWILMIGYTPFNTGPQLEADFIKIVKSIK